MRQTRERWQELARLESLAKRYRCSETGEPHWLCGVLRDAIDWNRKWLMRTERLGADNHCSRQDTHETLEAP